MSRSHPVRRSLNFLSSWKLKLLFNKLGEGPYSTCVLYDTWHWAHGACFCIWLLKEKVGNFASFMALCQSVQIIYIGPYGIGELDFWIHLQHIQKIYLYNWEKKFLCYMLGSGKRKNVLCSGAEHVCCHKVGQYWEVHCMFAVIKLANVGDEKGKIFLGVRLAPNQQAQLFLLNRQYCQGQVSKRFSSFFTR